MKKIVPIILATLFIFSGMTSIASSIDNFEYKKINVTFSQPILNYTTGGCIKSVAITPSGLHFVAAGEDQIIYSLGRFLPPLNEHKIAGSVRSVDISSSGIYIVAGTDDKRLYLMWYYPQLPF